MSASQKEITLKGSWHFIVLGLILAAAFCFRIYKLPTHFFICETQNVFNGLRLHTLSLFNFSGHFSENFFKSFFGNIAGVRFVFSTYVSSAIYTLLGIPLSEFWIRFFYVCVGTLNVFLTYFIGLKLSDYKAGLLGAAIIAVNNDSVLRSRSDNAEVTVTFFVTLSLLLFLHYRDHRTWIWRSLLGIVISFVGSMESIIMLPLLVFYQIILFPPCAFSFTKKALGQYGKYLFSRESVFLWLPYFFTLLMHIYVFKRVGSSNLGLFGYMRLNYLSRGSEVGKGLISTIDLNLNLYCDKYFGPWFVYGTLVAFLFVLIFKKKQKTNSAIRFSGIGVLYFFVMFLVFSKSNSTLNHLYICETVTALFFGSVWVAFFETIRERIKESRVNRFVEVAVYLSPCLFFVTQGVSEYQAVIKREVLAHPLKSMGYYIRKFGGSSPSVYTLLKCGSGICILANSEYYFGTQIINAAKWYPDCPRKLFCIGSKTISETLSSYGMNSFDFFVAIYGYSGFEEGDSAHFYSFRSPEIDSKIQELTALGAKKVATIRNKGVILGEIYSYRDLPFKDMEINEYDPQWDKTYANIEGIIKTRWTGMFASWGTWWDLTTGI